MLRVTSIGIHVSAGHDVRCDHGTAIRWQADVADQKQGLCCRLDILQNPGTFSAMCSLAQLGLRFATCKPSHWVQTFACWAVYLLAFWRIRAYSTTRVRGSIRELTTVLRRTFCVRPCSPDELTVR